jgi:hypothetical protein
MKGKIEQVVSKDVQPIQVKIQGKSRHEKGPVTARLAVNPAPHLGLEEDLRNLPGILDKGISHNGMDIIMMKGIFKRIRIGQKTQENNDQAEKKISSHGLFGSSNLLTPAFNLLHFQA